MNKNEIKIKWLGSPIILKIEHVSRGYDSPDRTIQYAHDDLGLTIHNSNNEWHGSYFYETRDKHGNGGLIIINDIAKTPQQLANKLHKNLNKLLQSFGDFEI